MKKDLYRRPVHRYYDTIHPKLLGLSFAINWIGFFIVIYFTCIIAWCLTFFFYSFNDPFPWAPTNGETIQSALISTDYFNKEFLHKSGGLFEIHSYLPWIMISMVIIIGLTFVVIYEGLDSAKYTIYFLVPFSYFLITILFIKGLTLDGNYIKSHNFLFEINID